MDRNNFTTPEREKGQHLGFAERCSIKTCKKLGLSLRKIADVVNCSASTVLNELRRGTGVRNGDRGRFPEYSAMRGQANYQTNRSRCHKQHKLQDGNPFINWMVKQVREKCWSLDICVGYARVQKLFPKECIVCSKTLYNELWAGNLPLTPFDLPEALSRKPRKCNVRKNRRILGKSIDERPEEAMMRIVYGHWEIDTVVGKRAGKESAVLTLVEKVSDFYLAIKIPGRDSASVMAALEVLGEEYGEEHFSEIFKTITADNGLEFERLSELEDLGVGVYFAHPYSSWERAQNERHNRLFRRFLPKGVSIDKYSAEQILSFADEMNALPRKLLSYCTPEELFDNFLDQVYSVIKVQAV
ncbi:MAG: IS30 family transposase [Clostridiales bacterium]|jgi:IS30 family transposase|nr:IS30 family transposase [Clostridiales bacterium]